MSNTNMDTCAICYDDIESTCDCYTTKCHHTMHNTCLTHWLFLKNNCPICRYNLCGKENEEEEEEEEYDSDEDEEHEVEDIQLSFSNKVYTSSYSSVLESLRELIFRLSTNEEEQEGFTPNYNWIYDPTNDLYTTKLNTRNEIINITLASTQIYTTLFLDVQFNAISKKITKFISSTSTKNIYVSNYTNQDLPTKISCF
jgi:hypothetical protein